MVKILSSEERTGDNVLKMLVYGASGVGKTVFGATAPDVIFLDAEAGMLSVRDKKIDRVKIITFQDIVDTFEFLKAGQHKYKTVVIDSLTECQKKAMDFILTKNNRDKATIGDWGENIEKVRKMIRHFRDLPMNVIFIMLESVEKEEETGALIKMPGMQGKTLPQETMGFVDIVGHMIAEERTIAAQKEGEKPVKEILRAMRVQPTKTICAKDRSGKLGIWLMNEQDNTRVPTFTQIYDGVFGERKEEKVIENKFVKEDVTADLSPQQKKETLGKKIKRTLQGKSYKKEQTKK